MGESMAPMFSTLEELPDMLEMLDSAPAPHEADEENNNLTNTNLALMHQQQEQQRHVILMSQQRHLLSPVSQVPPIPDLLADWENVTEEEIDRFIEAE